MKRSVFKNSVFENMVRLCLGTALLYFVFACVKKTTSEGSSTVTKIPDQSRVESQDSKTPYKFIIPFVPRTDFSQNSNSSFSLIGKVDWEQVNAAIGKHTDVPSGADTAIKKHTEAPGKLRIISATKRDDYSFSDDVWEIKFPDGAVLSASSPLFKKTDLQDFVRVELTDGTVALVGSITPAQWNGLTPTLKAAAAFGNVNDIKRLDEIIKASEVAPDDVETYARVLAALREKKIPATPRSAEGANWITDRFRGMYGDQEIFSRFMDEGADLARVLFFDEKWDYDRVLKLCEMHRHLIANLQKSSNMKDFGLLMDPEKHLVTKLTQFPGAQEKWISNGKPQPQITYQNLRAKLSYITYMDDYIVYHGNPRLFTSEKNSAAMQIRDLIVKDVTEAIRSETLSLELIARLVYIESHLTRIARGGGSVPEMIAESLLKKMDSSMTYLHRRDKQGFVIWRDAMVSKDVDDFVQQFKASVVNH